MPVVLSHPVPGSQSTASEPVDKWATLRDLTDARKALGISDRALSVLQALLSFHPETLLDPRADKPLVVFPSNKSICARLNGMATSTMRRHLSSLLSAGLLLRRDSPNGKRYVRRTGTGHDTAYGFDLSPLTNRAHEFARIAKDARQADAELKALRDQTSLKRRDIANLATWAAEEHPEKCWDAYLDHAQLAARALRRKLDLQQLVTIDTEMTAALDALISELEPCKPAEMSTCNAQIEQHHHESNKEYKTSDQPAPEPEISTETMNVARQFQSEEFTDSKERRLPLRLLLSVCSEVETYATEPIHDWDDLQRAGEKVRPMMGIETKLWNKTKAVMGPSNAVVTLLGILQKFATIHSPNGYLASLTTKFEKGRFSSSSMIFAMHRRGCSQL